MWNREAAEKRTNPITIVIELLRSSCRINSAGRIKPILPAMTSRRCTITDNLQGSAKKRSFRNYCTSCLPPPTTPSSKLQAPLGSPALKPLTSIPSTLTMTRYGATTHYTLSFLLQEGLKNATQAIVRKKPSYLSASKASQSPKPRWRESTMRCSRSNRPFSSATGMVAASTQDIRATRH